jgi:hypothetical protein
MLAPPLVDGPVSPCVRKLHVNGQLPGSTVSIFADGHFLASGVVAAAADFVALPAGTSLTPRQRLTARQTLGGDTSDATPDALAAIVLAMPAAADRYLSGFVIPICWSVLRNSAISCRISRVWSALFA